LLQPIEELVRIRQKTVKYSPVQKLMDGLITILAGAHGLSEINTRLRSDPALQRAFGRTGCAEQSVVQETLDASSATNVKQMEQATREIFQTHSLAYRHNYKQSWQVLDVDMTGLPCGSKSVKADKGYFSKEGIRHGRQHGRVIAAEYEEVVVDKLYNGKVQLLTAQRSLARVAAEALGLDEEKRKRTIIRVDAGGGSVDEVNWLLGADYQLHCKDFSSARAKNLAATVKEWVSDPHTPGRELGWVDEPGDEYVRGVRRLALRWKKKNGQMSYAVILSTLEPRDVILLAKQPIDRVSNERVVMGAYAAFYNQRGGTVEIEIKEDKQGVGMTKRSMKRFEAQQMVVLLGSLSGAQPACLVTPMVKRDHTEVERIWISPPGARCLSGERPGGTGCWWEGDQNCAQSEGGMGEEVYQRPDCSAQAGASGSYFGRNLGFRVNRFSNVNATP